MSNTEQSFRDKWFNNEKLVFAETLRPESDIFQWILREWLWCARRTTAFNSDPSGEFYMSVRYSAVLPLCYGSILILQLVRWSGLIPVAAPVAASNSQNYANISFREADLLKDLSGLGKFDFIYSSRSFTPY